ncbi:MAG: EVE domain-containing protein [Phycisphaerales bacterium]
MATFLLKTEPGEYAFADLVRDRRTAWTGVSNPAARIHLRSMKKGDEAFIYHTGDERAVVGVARIASAPREDPNRPGLNDRGEIAFPVVDIEPIGAAPTPVTLAALKTDARFAEFALIRQSRLSVMPVPAVLEGVLRKMAGLGRKG